MCCVRSPLPRMQSAKVEIHVILVVKIASWERAICLTIFDSSYPFWCESVETITNLHLFHVMGVLISYIHHVH